jgi:hypothetical protein
MLKDLNELELLKVNLQLFADEETISSGGGSEPQETEQETTEQDDEQETEETDEDESESNDRVPLGRFLEEKKRRKELERLLRENEEKHQSYQDKERVDKIRESVISKGYDEGVADLMADMFNEITKTMPKVDRVEQEILQDIQDYADENPEVLKHKKEIVEKIKKYRKVDPDFGIEQALSLIKPSKVRYNEVKTDIEQKNAIARRNNENRKVATSTGSPQKEKYPLAEADRKALEGLQKAQPDKGWTAEKLWKRMNNK